MLPSLSVGQSKSHTDEFGSHFERLQVHLNKWECRGKVHLHKFHNLSWITEINELFHHILIHWDAPVIYFDCKINEPKHIGMWWLNPAAAVHSMSINRQQAQRIPAFCFGASWSVNRTCLVLYKERTSSILWWSPRKSDVDRCITGWARAFWRGRFGCECLGRIRKWRLCLPVLSVLPFFPEVHEEHTRSWRAPFTARNQPTSSSSLTTLDGGTARGIRGSLRWSDRLRCSCVLILPPPGGANRASPPRACRYSSGDQYCGLWRSFLRLTRYGVLQAKAQRDLHEGGHTPKVLKELQTATKSHAPSDEYHREYSGSCDVHTCGPEVPTLAVSGQHKGRRRSSIPQGPCVSQTCLFGDAVENMALQFSVHLQFSVLVLPGPLRTPPLPRHICSSLQPSSAVEPVIGRQAMQYQVHYRRWITFDIERDIT